MSTSLSGRNTMVGSLEPGFYPPMNQAPREGAGQTLRPWGLRGTSEEVAYCCAACPEVLSCSRVSPHIQVGLSLRPCSWPQQEGDRNMVSGPLHVISTMGAKEKY